MFAHANDQITRAPAVAGRFYPAGALELGRMVEALLEGATVDCQQAPKAVIAPHAGYVYSGPVAGSAFRSWSERGQAFDRIIVLGPSHRVEFEGIALPRATSFSTPLGKVPLDLDAVGRLRNLPQVLEFDLAHEGEHCVEVELPFLQVTRSRFSLVPLVIGDTTDEQLREVIELLWGGPETRFVMSSDLSHYHDYHAARDLDAATAKTIELSHASGLTGEQACGFRAIRSFLLSARARGIHARTVDLRNSGDTSGARDRVVGYGAFLFA